MAIKKQKDGRYKVDQRDAFGKRHQRMFEKLTDARDYEDAIKKERLDHKLIGAGARKVRYRIDDAVRDFKASKADLTPRTTKRYNYILDQFEHFCAAVGIAYVNEFSTDLATEYYGALIAEKKDPKGSTDRILKPKPKTVNMYLMVVRAVFNQEVAAGHIARSPFLHIKPLKIERKRPDFFSENELKRFFAQPISRPYWLFFLGLLDTGMRFNEAASLRWEDVDFKKRVLHVHERSDFDVKTPNANRTIPISERLYEELEKLRKEPYSEDFVFATKTGRQIPERTALDKCKKAAKKAGIKVAKLHKFRHTFASHLVQMGVKIQDVSKLLGHSSIKETEVYAYLAPDGMHLQVNIICNVKIK